MATSVGFSAYLTTAANPDTGEILVFDQVEYNEGDHCSTTKGTFTCPQSGVYFFTATLFTFLNEELISYEIRVAGKHVAGMLCSSSTYGSDRVMCGNSVVVKCSAQKTVHVECSEKTVPVYGFLWDQLTTFSGLLIHAD